MNDMTPPKVTLERLNFSAGQNGGMEVDAGFKVITDAGLVDLSAEFEIEVHGHESWDDIVRIVYSRIRSVLQEFPG
jgi:hypothetical protein